MEYSLLKKLKRNGNGAYRRMNNYGSYFSGENFYGIHEKINGVKCTLTGFILDQDKREEIS